MVIKLFNNYPDFIGKRQAICGSVTGPSSYVVFSGVGDPISVDRFTYYIDALSPCVTINGTYRIEPIPNGANLRAAWKARWVVVSTGAEVTAGTDLSGQSAVIFGLGGQN